MNIQRPSAAGRNTSHGTLRPPSSKNFASSSEYGYGRPLSQGPIVTSRDYRNPNAMSNKAILKRQRDSEQLRADLGQFQPLSTRLETGMSTEKLTSVKRVRRYRPDLIDSDDDADYEDMLHGGEFDQNRTEMVDQQASRRVQIGTQSPSPAPIGPYTDDLVSVTPNSMFIDRRGSRVNPSVIHAFGRDVLDAATELKRDISVQLHSIQRDEVEILADVSNKMASATARANQALADAALFSLETMTEKIDMVGDNRDRLQSMKCQIDQLQAMAAKMLQEYDQLEQNTNELEKSIAKDEESVKYFSQHSLAQRDDAVGVVGDLVNYRIWCYGDNSVEPLVVDERLTKHLASKYPKVALQDRIYLTTAVADLYPGLEARLFHHNPGLDLRYGISGRSETLAKAYTTIYNSTYAGGYHGGGPPPPREQRPLRGPAG